MSYLGVEMTIMNFAGLDPVFLTTLTEGSDVEEAENLHSELVAQGESIFEIKTSSVVVT